MHLKLGTMRRFIAALLMLISVSTLAHAVQVTSTWTGAGDGTSYTDPANWSTPDYPRNGVPAGTTYKVVVDNNAAKVANVNYNAQASIDALVVTQGDSFNINSGFTLIVANSGAGTGSIVNSGTIRINATTSTAAIRIQGDVTLGGGGAILMSDTNPRTGASFALLFGSATTDRLTNTDNTISGSGLIGNGQTVLINRGTITATATGVGKPLILNPTAANLSNGSTTHINTGLLRANGATLRFFGGTYDNSGGTIEALNGSVVELQNLTINGGTLQTTGDGVINGFGFNGGYPTLVDLTNKGTLQAPSGGALALAGTLTNSGTIRIGTSTGAANVRINSDVTLKGGGNVILSDIANGGNNFNAGIFGISPTTRLTNVDNTISGGGSIGQGVGLSGGQLVFINQGTVIANNPNKPLLIVPTASSTTNVNTGTLRANGGTLNFQFGTFDNTGGTIEALNGSVVELRGPTFNGGTLQTTGTGVFRTTSLNAEPTLANLTTKGNVEAAPLTSLSLAGNIVNSGTISVRASANGGASLRIKSDVTLSGGGNVTFTDDNPNVNSNGAGLFGVTPTTQLINVDNTLSGAGNIGGGGGLSGGQLVFINQGTVIANNPNKLLTVSTTASSTNNVNTGTLRANGGTLQIQGGTFDNSGGIIEALDGSVVQPFTVTIVGGIFQTTGTGVVRPIDNGDRGFVTLDGITNKGRIEINRRGLLLAGNIVNQGTISIDQGSIRLIRDVTFSGGGTVTLLPNGTSNSSSIFGAAVTIGLTNADNTIQGAGSINQVIFTNNGTLLANDSLPLSVDVAGNNNGNFVNTGTIRANAGSTLALGNADILTQTAGLTLVNGTLSGTVALNGGTLAGTGTIVGTVTNAATVSPGEATGPDDSMPGVLTVNGRYIQTSAGKLFIQINGPKAGEEFDQLKTTNLATFAGALNVKLGDSYAPERGTSFFIVTYSSKLGQMTLSVLDRDNRGGFFQLYDPRVLILTAEGTPFFGVSLTPTNPNTTALLTATLRTSSPATGVTYDFRRNGISVQNGPSPTYDLSQPGAGDKGDVISVVARTDDDRSNSNQVTVFNSIPFVENAKASVDAGKTVDLDVNAFDRDGDALTFGRNGPSNGTAEFVTVNGLPKLRYTPRADFGGTEIIKVYAFDGEQTTDPLAIFTITVNFTAPPAVNRPPVAFSTTARVNAEQQIDIPVSASDPDGDPITFSVVNNPRFGFGSFVTVNGNTFYRYRSIARFNGNDEVNFHVLDDKNRPSNTANISIDVNFTAPSVNRPPTANSTSATVDADREIDIPVSGSDPDGDPITYVVVTGARNGTGQFVTLNGATFFRYRSRARFNGTEEIVFVTRDDKNRDSQRATISIRVNFNAPRVNRPPVANSTSLTVQNGPIQPGGNVQLTGSDPDGDAITFQIVNRPKHGSATLSTSGGRTTLRYLPAAGYAGSDSLTFVTVDTSGRTSNVATVSITVNGPPRPIQAAPQTSQGGSAGSS